MAIVVFAIVANVAAAIVAVAIVAVAIFASANFALADVLFLLLQIYHPLGCRLGNSWSQTPSPVVSPDQVDR